VTSGESHGRREPWQRGGVSDNVQPHARAAGGGHHPPEAGYHSKGRLGLVSVASAGSRPAPCGLPLTSRQVLTVCLALTIGVGGVLDAIVAKTSSQTLDETDHTAYGLRILRGQPDRAVNEYFDSKTPSTALNAIPHFIGDRLEGQGSSPRLIEVLHSYRLARVASFLALLLLNVFVFRWAYDLYGSPAGLAAAIMVVLSPNLIAHGTLTSTDGYFALGVVGSLYVFRRYLLDPTVRNAWLSGLALALAQLTKPFAIYLYAIVGVSLLLATRGTQRGPTALTRRDLAFYAAISAVLFIAVIDTAYSFDRPFTPLQAYHFESAPFLHLQQAALEWPILRDIRVPLAYPFLQGLDMMKAHEATGATFGNPYLLGEVRSISDPSFHGFKSYYAVAVFFKEPIALQILAVWGLIWIWRHRTRGDVLRGEGVLMAAAVVLVLWMSFFDKAQIGIRHILPALAINVIIASAAFSDFAALPRPKQIALGLLLVWMGLSVASYYPEMIPYMNEWVTDRRYEYKILGDSNLDYGQDWHLVDDFMRKNPDVVLNPPTPTCGRVLISTNLLQGVLPLGHPPRPMIWALRERPVAQVGYAHLLYVFPATVDTSGTAKGCDRR
jgi:hypothetical protein